MKLLAIRANCSLLEIGEHEDAPRLPTKASHENFRRLNFNRKSLHQLLLKSNNDLFQFYKHVQT